MTPLDTKEAENKPRIFDITAEWLFATNSDDEPRSWIRGKYFYITNKGWGDSENGLKSKTGYAPRKYRLIGRLPDKYALRIVDYKDVGGFGL